MNTPDHESPASSVLSLGSRFGNYNILQRMGAGGMGEVYRAWDTSLEREVAIKTLSLENCCEPEALARFHKEARLACTLNHPNIVTVYELGEVNGTSYIAMELLRGETVRQLLSAGPIPFRKAAAIAAQIADALSKAHELGVVHRDIKPENLIVSSDAVTKVLDFGLAKLRRQNLARSSNFSSTTFTNHGTVMGTVGYMSPEQATGGGLDFRSDQFSFGAVLYEMVTGIPAFRRATDAESIAAILRDQPERAKMQHVPQPFIWIVERCLAKDPKSRYASTADLVRDLVAVRDRLSESPTRQSEFRINTLPTQPTAFIGREHETRDLSQLLGRDDVRLVTLTGPGGIGKTRLALQVAAHVANQFPGGVCFVPLSPVGETSLIASTIAKAMGMREQANQSALESLNEFMSEQERPLLLLLDNFEHLLSAAQVVSQLLSAGAKLKIMVTSQAPLHVYGEHEFPLPPLALPDLRSIPPIEVLAGLPAIALFVERAKAVKPDFVLNHENASVVAAVCARLDGLPLAIELAAARIKLLSASAMLARLESRLKLLTGGPRDLPTRQQTLRGTLDWSYGLLNTAEQTLLRRLSVFVGGCTLEGVESVCDTKGDLGLEVFDCMASLVDKSLVQRVERADEETRFTLLFSIREYALEHLATSGDAPATQRAHAAYYLVLAEEGAQEVAAQSEWLDRLEAELDNFRVALDYLITTGEADWGLRLGTALFRFWETREYLVEGRDTIVRLLALEGTAARPKLRVRLLFAAAVLAGEQGDYDSARRLFESSLESCVELDDNRGVAVALNAMAVNSRNRGELDDALLLFERSLHMWKDIGDSADIARALSNLANVAKLQGDYGRASALYDECLIMFRSAGDGAGVAWTLNHQGDVARERGDFVAARSFSEESLSAFRQLRDSWGIASALSDLAGLSYDQGNNPEACRLYAESIRRFQELGHKRGVARVLECLAANAAAQSNAEQALRWAGTAAALRERLGVPLTPADQPKLEKALEFARRSLDSKVSLTAWMEGWAMPVEQAVEEAMNCGVAFGPDP
jgi:predicted ATPase